MEELYDTQLTPDMFQKFTQLLFRESGITLKDHKKYLLIHRLSKMVGTGREFPDYEHYYHALIQDKKGDLIKGFVNILTTNYSFFFREEVHFDFLKDYLLQQGQSQDFIRLWSAACSTGEESYSMAISILQTLKNTWNKDIKILASDISTRVLNIANEGRYHYTKVRGHLEDSELRNYFDFDREHNDFIVKPAVRNLISFRYLNLFDPYPFKKDFDVVFLRNVLIYFDNQEKEQIINKIYEHIKPGGYLILGLSESMVGLKHPYRHMKNSLYQK